MRERRRRQGTSAENSLHASSAKRHAQRWLCERLEHRAAPSDSLGILFAPALAGSLIDPPLVDDLGEETVIDRAISDGEGPLKPVSADGRGSHYRPADDARAAAVESTVTDVDPTFDPHSTGATAGLPSSALSRPDLSSFVGRIGGPSGGLPPAQFSAGGLSPASIDASQFAAAAFPRAGASAPSATAAGVVDVSLDSAAAGEAGNTTPSNQPEPNRRSRGDSSGGTAEGTSHHAAAGAVGATAHARGDHVNWDRIAVKYAEREGTLKTNKQGEPDRMAALTDLAKWFNKRLEHRGFGELRDQLVAEFPEEPTGGTKSGGFVEAAGHGTLTSFHGCGSGSSGAHLVLHEDEYYTAWNDADGDPHHSVLGAVLDNDQDCNSEHVLSVAGHTPPQNGVMTMNSDGGFEYTPNNGYIGPEMMFYYAYDGYVSASVPLSIYVYWPDIDVDSDNNGTIDPDNTAGGADDPMEGDPGLPGKILPVNDDDDNGNGVPDYDDAPFLNGEGLPMADDDLVEMELDMMFANHAFFTDYTMWMRVTSFDYANAELRIWDSPTKDNQIVAAAYPLDPLNLNPYDDAWLMGTEQLPASLWIEGLVPSLPPGLQLSIEPAGFPAIRDEAFVAVVDVDLEIRNGQDPRYPVAQLSESGKANDVGKGAFTVANINDTDGDGTLDSFDDLVKPFSANIVAGGTAGMDEVTVDDASGFSLGDQILFSPLGHEVFSIAGFDGTNPNRIYLNGVLVNSYVGGTVKHPGRDEVDLMKLVVKKPTVVMPNTNVRLSVVSGNVALWTSPTKGSANAVALVGGAVEFNVDNIPAGGIVLWIEALGQSNTLRDIELRLDYMGASDIVNATAVWSIVTDVRHDNGEGVWIDANNPTFAFNQLGGFGLIPVLPNGFFGNVIGLQFTVEPSGIGLEPNVFFDISRQLRKKTWDYRLDDTWVVSEDTSFPIEPERPNDDLGNEDESDIPTANNTMYVGDGPGFIPGAINTTVVSQSNFREFMRVVFEGGQKPMGNEIIGSQASAVFNWNVRHWLVKPPGQNWQRSTGDNIETNSNGISTGHIVIGTGNQP